MIKSKTGLLRRHLWAGHHFEHEKIMKGISKRGNNLKRYNIIVMSEKHIDKYNNHQLHS